MASQSTAAPMAAAASPGTAVGKTSPWSSQPVPPMPIANAEMKKAKPTITITIRCAAVKYARPNAPISGKRAIPT